MLLTINGTPVDISAPCSILEYLQQKNLEPLHVVVERNGALVPREAFVNCMLVESDTIEILRFVGGG